MGLVLGYNTNGLTDHRLEDALEVIAGLGYRAVGLTLHPNHLDPHRLVPGRLARLRARLDGLGLERRVVETGARYLLDPWTKHEPGLAHPDPGERARRVDLGRRAAEIAAALGAEAVAFAAGRGDPDDDEAFARVVEGTSRVVEACRAAGVAPAFEPEPGMVVETLADWERLRAEVGPDLRMTLDVGHVRCEGREIPGAVREHASAIANVHIEDIRGRVHEHLPPGEGDIAFGPVLDALRTHVADRAPVCVELARDIHRGPTVARAALVTLRGGGA